MKDIPANTITLSVVIPAYNEARKIGGDLSLLYDYLGKQDYEYEVIVVDDGSSDGTGDVVKSLEGRYRNLRCIRCDRNRGKGYAVRTGVLEAKGEYVLFADAGTCVPYREVERGLRALREGYDVALGSRALAGSEIVRRQPKYRQMGSRLFEFCISRMFAGLDSIHDTQCGFKVFKREAAREIFGRNRIDGFMFDIETILNAGKMGYRLTEFPVSWRNDPDTRFKPVIGSLRNFIELCRIRFPRA